MGGKRERETGRFAYFLRETLRREEGKQREAGSRKLIYLMGKGRT